ncbi:MAG: AAA family ATPase [Myxococcota bacterium]
MAVEQESLDLLREVIDRWQATGELPPLPTLRQRFDQRPWVVDDLLGQGLLVDWSGPAGPTLAGIREAQGDSSPLVEQVQKLANWLRRQLGKRVELAPAAAATGLEPRVVKFALGVLAGSGVGFSGPQEWAGAGLQSTVAPTTSEWFGRLFPDRAVPSPTGPVRICAADFRVLTAVNWTLEPGVSLLAGTNGAGKTSVLDLLAVLRDVFEVGPGPAIARQLGVDGLRRLGASGAVVLSVAREPLTWEVQLAVSGAGLQEFPQERLAAGDRTLVRRGALSPDWYLGAERIGDAEPRAAFRGAWERTRDPAWNPLVQLLRGYRKYGSYDLTTIRRGGSSADDNTRLADSGQNLVHVLRNWKSAEVRFERRYEWVLTHLRAAFPGLVETLEFGEPLGAALPAYFYPPGSADALPLSRAADGLLVGLLHLVAAAGCPPGGVIAIDEVENQLHPHAIRTLVAALRERAEQDHSHLVLTTHSPVVMNEFGAVPDRFFVLEQGHDVLPVRLTAVHDRDWLELNELGELYVQNKFAAPNSVR